MATRILASFAHHLSYSPSMLQVTACRPLGCAPAGPAPPRMRPAAWGLQPGRRYARGVARDLRGGQNASASAPQAEQLVDEVLQGIKGTDGGDNVSLEQRRAIDGAIMQLEALGEAQDPRPLASDLIFGNYDVAYVSAGAAQGRQPAGGRFRGVLGKLIFRTTHLCQSVLQPDLVVNKVGFKVLGFIPGSVGLRGRLVSVPEREGGPDSGDTVKVFFDRPVLSLPGSIHVRIGPPSTVVLKTTYLDERVRLGKGSRGSLFVFARGGDSDAVGMESVGLEQTTPFGVAMLGALMLCLVANGVFLASRVALPWPLRALGVMSALLGLGIGNVCANGGILGSDEDRPEVAAPPGEAAREQQPAAPAAAS